MRSLSEYREVGRILRVLRILMPQLREPQCGNDEGMALMQVIVKYAEINQNTLQTKIDQLNEEIRALAQQQTVLMFREEMVKCFKKA